MYFGWVKVGMTSAFYDSEHPKNWVITPLRLCHVKSIKVSISIKIQFGTLKEI